MVKCSFCNITIPVGTGKIYVKKEGKVLYFCTNKCEKNMIKLGRKPAKYKWTDVSKLSTKDTKAENKKESPKKKNDDSNTKQQINATSNSEKSKENNKEEQAKK